MKKIVAIMLASMLLCAAACALAETHTVTDGVFEFYLIPEGRDPMYNFFHFYENGVFYASMYGGAQYAAGHYEVKDVAYEYVNAAGEIRNIPQTIVMTKMDGKEYCTVGYDAENGVLEPVSVMYYSPFSWAELNPDIAKENGVSLYEYVVPDDEYSVLSIKHNGTYLDTVGALVEGTWTLDSQTYILADDDSDDVYTLTLKDNGDLADYTTPDGEVTELKLVKPAEKVLAFSGSDEEGTLGKIDTIVDCFDSGEAILTMTIGGNEQVLPGGAWEMAADFSHIDLTIRGTKYQAPINPEDHSFSFEMTMNINGTDMVFAMSTK